MKVKLPRQCSGQEIVKAFKAASTFQEGPEKKWNAQDFVEEYQYEPGSVKQTVRSSSVHVWPSFFRKKWWLFGEKVWKSELNPKFILNSVRLATLYDEVDIVVDYVYAVDQAGGEYKATNPSSPKFEDIRPQFERILGGFYAQLKERSP